MGPEPGSASAASPAACRPRPPGLPAKVSGAARAAQARDWGAAGEGPRGLAGMVRAPAVETCQGAEGGGVGSDPGAGCPAAPAGKRLGSGRRTALRGPSFLSLAGATWKGVAGWLGDWVLAGVRGLAAVQVKILELWGGAAGVVRCHFCPQDGRRRGGHRGLLIEGAPREVAAGRPEIVLEP